ncbi:hypothetical protein Tco_1075960 [Tanacetum coccineum]
MQCVYRERLGLRVLANEEANAGDGVQMIQVWIEIDSAGSGLAGRCAAERHADLVAADYCYRDEQNWKIDSKCFP